MLTLIPDLPEGVVGVEAQGQVSASDYEQVLLPAVNAAREAADDGKVRLLYVLGSDVPDYTVGAAWEDAKLGLGRIRSWERIAIVSDAEWLRQAIHGLGWMMPGEVKVFGTTEANDARTWVAS
jgi:stage II sporulation SpoAA-like protein